MYMETGKTFPAIPFSCATAAVAMEQKNGNGTTECHNGTAERQQNGGNWKPGIIVMVVNLVIGEQPEVPCGCEKFWPVS